MSEAKSKQKAVPILQQGLKISKRHKLTVANSHHFRVAIAKAQERTCEDVFNSRFDSALEELFDGPYSADDYVDAIKEQADFFIEHLRPDLAVLNYDREIQIMLKKLPANLYRGAAFANYHALVEKAKIYDPSNKSVPSCNRCNSNNDVVPDFPQGCVIYKKYHWRCKNCKNTF